MRVESCEAMAAVLAARWWEVVVRTNDGGHVHARAEEAGPVNWPGEVVNTADWRE